jgi:hypothetical protein
MPGCFTAVTRWYRYLAYSDECTSMIQMHCLLYDGDDWLGGRAKHVTAMKRMTNVQALVNCNAAMKRVPSKLEVLLWCACGGRRYCWIQGTEKGRLLRVVARFPITLAEVIIQVLKRTGRWTLRPGQVVCGARACGVNFIAGAPLGWADGDLALLVWWFWCRQCFSDCEVSWLVHKACGFNPVCC